MPEVLDIWRLVRLLRQDALESGGLDDLAGPEREARVFAHVIEHLPIGFELGETLAGDFGPGYMDKEDRVALAERLAQLHADRAASPVSPECPFRLLRDRFHCHAGYTAAHTCADYQRVVEDGIVGLLTEVRAAAGAASVEQGAMLRGMEICLEAVVYWAERYAELARRMASDEADEDARDALDMIASTCARVPLHPAETFHEAVQSVWLVHAAIGLSEVSGSSLSLGRADQYLYRLFAQDIGRGAAPEQLERSLRDLWKKLNRFGDPACAVNLGGADQAGRDLFNPLSAMMVRVTRALRLPSPILAARIHDRLPAHVFDMYVDPELFTMGQPTFYGEGACRQAMMTRGVPRSDAHNFAANSCMGLVMPGEEISDMWGAVVSLLLPLELALNRGRPFRDELPVQLATRQRETYAAFDDLFAQFAAYLDEIVALLIARNRESTMHVGRERPNPFLSALIRDCVSEGQDRAIGGAKYHTVIVEAFGWANAADSLTAIKRLSFDRQVYAIADMVGAAQRDFEGDGDVLGAILRCPKYGNNEEEADAMARRVAKCFARCVRRHSHGSVHYAPSLHTLNAHVAAGKKLGASLDGRRTGEPLGKNAGPMLGRSRNGLTSLLLSASSIDQSVLDGGQALDISVAPHTVSAQEGRRKFESLLETYFERGGLQVQVNAATAAQLRQAIAHPDIHRDLIVKIAGYSARFVSLARDIQEEMVERFEQGL